MEFELRLQTERINIPGKRAAISNRRGIIYMPFFGLGRVVLRMTPAQVLFTRISTMLTETKFTKSCADAYDREIPVNIVDLGRSYRVTLEAAWSRCG
jgi:hypothetical protein